MLIECKQLGHSFRQLYKSILVKVIKRTHYRREQQLNTSSQDGKWMKPSNVRRRLQLQDQKVGLKQQKALNLLILSISLIVYRKNGGLSSIAAQLQLHSHSYTAFIIYPKNQFYLTLLEFIEKPPRKLLLRLSRLQWLLEFGKYFNAANNIIQIKDQLVHLLSTGFECLFQNFASFWEARPTADQSRLLRCLQFANLSRAQAAPASSRYPQLINNFIDFPFNDDSTTQRQLPITLIIIHQQQPMFRNYSRLFASYFSKIKPSPALQTPLHPHRLWLRRLILPFSATVCYNLLPYFSKRDNEEPTKVQEDRREVNAASKTAPGQGSIRSRIWNGLVHILRFMQLLLIFSPVIILSPLLLFQKTRNYWSDLFVKAIERSGVVFIKAFQYLSHRRDIIGPELANKFQYLRENAPTHPFQTTQNYFREAYGQNINDIFDKFDTTPIASGSVSQVYKAVYKGKKVAVKVRHPDVDKHIERDINLLFFLSYLASFFSPAMEVPISESSLKKTLSQQMDFTFEMRNLNKFKKMFKARQDVEFPSPVEESTKDSVLVQSFVEGVPVTYYETNRHPLNKVIAKLGSQVLFEMLMKNNFVHADCHGGNIFISTEEKPYNFFTQVWDFLTDIWYVSKFRIQAQTLSEQRIKQVYLQYCEEQLKVRKLIRTEKKRVRINLLDAGMVVTLDQRDKRNFSKFIKSVIECRGNDCAEMIFSLSNYDGQKITRVNSKFDSYHKELTNCFSRLNQSSYNQLQGMALLWDMMRIIRQNKMKLDGEFATLLTNIIVLEGIGRSLDPEINILKCAFPYFKYIEEDEKPSLFKESDLNLQTI